MKLINASRVKKMEQLKFQGKNDRCINECDIMSRNMVARPLS